MKLQILVPQYNETDIVVKPLLDSIAIQQNVDFKDIGVIICNDGSDTLLSRDFLDSYPYRIDYHLEKHRGISATRNSCFDYAEADYVQFCDADDMFLNVCAFQILYSNMAEGFDTLTSTFIEESRERTTGEIIYVTHDFDATYVHGKVHNRQYLIDNNLRFKDELMYNEDSYFTVLVQTLAKTHKHCKTPFYLWKWNPNSVCRSEPNKRLKMFNTMIDSNDYLVDELESRGFINKALGFVAYMIIETYYTLNKPMWLQNPYYADLVEKRIATYFKKHESQWNVIPNANKLDIAFSLRERAVKEEMGFEVIAFNDWLEKIKEM